MSDFYHTEYSASEIQKMLLVGSRKTAVQINPQSRAAFIDTEGVEGGSSSLREIKLAFAQASAKTDLFKGMSIEDILKVTNNAQILNFSRKEKLFSEGDVSMECYFVLAGFVDVFVNTKGSNRESVQIGRVIAGNIFGEMAFLLNAPRTATCIATENTALLKFEISEYEDGKDLSKIFLQLFINMSISLAYKLKRIDSEKVMP